MKGKKLSGLLVLLVMLPLLSCGGGGTGGGATVFDTVDLVPSYTGASPFDSDVAKHEDASPGICGGPEDNVTFLPDIANFTIRSTARMGIPAGTTISSVRIDTVTISYTPTTQQSPPIPAQVYALGVVIAPGTTASIPVTIASQVFMKSVAPLSALVCTGDSYSYRVTVRFAGQEIESGRTGSFSTDFSIIFADFID